MGFHLDSGVPIPNQIFCFKSVQVFLGGYGGFFFNHIFNSESFACSFTAAIFVASNSDAEEISLLFFI